MNSKEPAINIETILQRVDGIMPLVGRTPLLNIEYRFEGRPRRIFAKYEAMNMTGSIKDRMALWILRRSYEEGRLQPGDTIVEASSGNTGIAFSAVGRALGHHVRVYMPNWMSRERIDLIRGFGADIVLISKEQGGFLGSIEMAEVYAREHDHVFLPRQFANQANVEAHIALTGPEIEAQLTALGLAADAFVAGVGTGGTVMGVGEYLRRKRPVRVHPLEPTESPTLKTGCKVGKHRIQGISDEFIPAIVKLDQLDWVVDVHDGDSILMAQALSRKLGLGVGISSGANFLGAAQVLEEMGGEAVVVTILSDSNKKYLSTDLYHEEPVVDGYWTPRIELLRFTAVGFPCRGDEANRMPSRICNPGIRIQGSGAMDYASGA
jgi:cysteine synthase A